MILADRLKFMGKNDLVTWPWQIFDYLWYRGDGISGRVLDLSAQLHNSQGVVIIKNLGGGDWIVQDTINGPDYVLNINNSNPLADSGGQLIQQFNNDNIVIGNHVNVNEPDDRIMSFAFGSADLSSTHGKGFSVKKYTGPGSNFSLLHEQGAVPTSFWIKPLSQSGSWSVYHHQMDLSDSHLVKGVLDTYAPIQPTTNFPSPPDDTYIYLSGDIDVNGAGIEYLIIIFNDFPGVFKAGSFFGTSEGLQVDCGFTNGVDVLILKNTSQAYNGSWIMHSKPMNIGPGDDDMVVLESSGSDERDYDLLNHYDPGFFKNASAYMGRFIYFAFNTGGY